ncbi:hypothetical protein [Micropruina sonneratiae]|uniref:hypothetical protein n=1 Tax=Micropruina sonneratiae TaxID=2986940 RepID=UPI0022273ACB|nr:hypothetical protein [Micropruina sp. KQZ13P-5]MCW3157515.1 hypothetical protein [Micropruina sp. KQZ13P-5]
MLQNRPPWLVVAVAATGALGLVFLTFAGISAAGGHGLFSLQIGFLLALYGLLLIGSAVGVWLLRMWARGPLVALTLMAGFGFGEYLLDQPWMWLLVLLCLAAVVGAVLPSTTRALQQVRSADRHRRQAGRRTAAEPSDPNR